MIQCTKLIDMCNHLTKERINLTEQLEQVRVTSEEEGAQLAKQFTSLTGQYAEVVDECTCVKEQCSRLQEKLTLVINPFNSNLNPFKRLALILPISFRLFFIHFHDKDIAWDNRIDQNLFKRELIFKAGVVFIFSWRLYLFNDNKGGGPRVVVSTAAFHARVRGSVPGLGGLQETKNVSSPSKCESQYCGEPPWPRGSVLGLRPPGLEFRILCLEDSVISIISPSSGGSPGPV